MATREEDVVTQLFVASTHTPVLFFSSRGMVYTHEGVAPAGRRRRSRAARRWSTCCRSSRARASPRSCRCPRTRRPGTSSSDVRHPLRRRAAQQALPTSSSINRNGKIAMKLDEGDRIVGVAICTPRRRRAADHGAAAAASASRVDDVRVFKGRDSTGVRGITPGRGRRGDLDGDPAPRRGDARRARGLPQAGAAPCARAQGEEIAEGEPRPSAEAEEAAGEASTCAPERYRRARRAPSSSC